jgi:UDP-N-acetylmuramoyl-tripeptide--D-alanyl-D-alanine ligase
VIDLSPQEIARLSGAELATVPAGIDAGPVRAVIDSRQAGPGDLFVGLVGEHVDGGAFAEQALDQGAWGVLLGPDWDDTEGDVVLVAEDPLKALQQLATGWRRRLQAQVIGITGSVGKTSTKDLTVGMVGQRKSVVGTPQNWNTEIGLPLTILSAPPGTQVLVLEMAMRGAGQIAELAQIAEPDVGVITNIAPVHLELLGSIEAIAAEKASLIEALKPGAVGIMPRDEPLLDPFARSDLDIVRFGPGDDLGDLQIPFTSAFMKVNASAARHAARAVGVEPHGLVEVELSAMRGERITLPGNVTIVNDCYNANPMAVRAALDDLASAAPGRRVAVLGDMLELGPDEERYHREIGEHARTTGVDVLVAVGPRSTAMAGDHHVATAADAAALLPELLQDGDTVLVKGSRGVGLEVVAESLTAGKA